MMKFMIKWLPKINLIFWILLTFTFGFLLSLYANRWFSSIALRYTAYLFVVAIGFLILHITYPLKPLLYKLLTALFTTSVVLHLFYFATEVSDYPFSMNWSEASRYYYASLFLSEKIYGEKLAWSPLHPSRYLLQAVPFLFSTPLWFHRLWQSLLWVGLTALGAFSLANRLEIRDRWLRYLAISGGFLFFLIGPIYYHLMVCVIPVLLSFSSQPKNAKELIFSYTGLITVSIWAGLSRINWYPVPAFLACILYFLEVPYGRSGIRYFLKPFVWSILGIGIAYLTREIYISISGNPSEFFNTSFSSPLLWHRLLPNATYPPGILLGSIGVIFPFALIFILYLHKHWREISLWRWTAITAILGIFYVGGVIVSLKVGGGSNLHNLDAFWSFFAVFIGYLLRSKIESDYPEITSSSTDIWTEKGFTFLCVLSVLIPVLHPIGLTKPFLTYDPAKTSVKLQKMQKILDQSIKGEVLFISERHLLTFGLIRNIEIVPDYERVLLMEMVMANNVPYVERFHQDIQMQRYHYIVIDPLPFRIASARERFGVENNLWVEKIALPLLCYYKPYREAYMLFRDTGIQILERRTNPSKKYCQ